MKKIARILAVVMILLTMCTFIAACTPEETKSTDTIRVGYLDFSSKFSPFFAKTSYDQDVASMTQVSLFGNDRLGELVLKGIEGETRKFNGTDYKYTGISDVTVSKGATETVYNIKLKEGIKFSDGKPMTINDVIFSMYVLSDPSYTGSSTFYSTPIKGMEAYRTNGKDMTELTKQAEAFIADAKVAALKKGVEYTFGDLAKLTTEQKAVLAAAGLNEAVTADQEKAFEWAMVNGLSIPAFQWAIDYTVPGLIKAYGLPENSTEADVYKFVLTDELCGLAFNKDNTAVDSAFFKDYEGGLVNAKAMQLAQDVDPNDVVKSISGIKKLGDFEVEVTTDSFEATAIYQLGISVSPLHYYGNKDTFNGTDNFGFAKNNLKSVTDKTTAPMGAGAYKFVKFEKGIVYFERNELFFKGNPKTKYVQFVQSSEADMLPGIVANTFDISSPSLSDSVIKSINAANTDTKDLVGNKITTSMTDFLGYGYIGLNADNVKVAGKEAGSMESKALRSAYTTLFAVYRDSVVASYYGDRASVIQYPISNTSWAAPRAGDAGYQIAYSEDASGKPIYTPTMTEEQKYAAAKTAALGFFKKAGYTVAGDKAMGVPTFTIIIPGGGSGDHPTFAVLTAVQKVLKELNVTLEINDPADSNVLWDSLDAGTADMFVAAWGATIDPDMYQVYHSSNVVGAPGSTNSNHYHIKDTALDKLIMDARGSDNNTLRKAMYKEALELLMSWSVEVPVYQRQEATTTSTERVKIETLTKDMTSYYSWKNEIETIEMK